MLKKLLRSKDTVLIADAHQATLARRIAATTGYRLVELERRKFADGEFELDVTSVQALKNVHAVIIHASSPSVHANFMWILFVARALQLQQISMTLVMPYCAYARQKVAFEAIAALLQAAGISSLITIALHEPSYIQHVAMPIEHITLDAWMAQIIKECYPQGQLTIIAPDEGGKHRAQAVAQMLQAPLVVCSKERYGCNEVSVKAMQGTCNTPYALIIDDMINTGSTLLNVAQMIHAQNKDCIIDAFAIHGVFSGDALQHIQQSALHKVFVTNTIKHDLHILPDKIEVLDISDVLATKLLA